MGIRHSGVMGGSIEVDGERLIGGVEIDERIDERTGKVVEINRSIDRPSRARRHVIHDRGYQRIRAYIVRDRLELARLEDWRAARQPVPKPRPTRRPKRIESCVPCPDCTGSGWLDGECRACQGEGWRRG